VVVLKWTPVEGCGSWPIVQLGGSRRRQSALYHEGVTRTTPGRSQRVPPSFPTVTFALVARVQANVTSYRGGGGGGGGRSVSV